VWVFVVRRILAHVDTGQPDENKWPSVGAEDGSVVDFNFAKRLYRLGKLFHGGNQVIIFKTEPLRDGKQQTSFI